VRYWWVNQNQTFRQEIEGGYLWSPKRNKNGHRNPFYEFMREVAPGDIVLSFCDTRIAALGIISGYCHESPKPEEFGTAGIHWSQVGWRVGVRWQRLSSQIRPKDHIARLRSELSSKYAPMTPEGNGLQSVYLTEISRGLASTLFALIGAEANRVADVGQEVGRIERESPAPERDIEEWERRVEAAITTDAAIPHTERTALVQARRGQGLFRDNGSVVLVPPKLASVDAWFSRQQEPSAALILAAHSTPRAVTPHCAEAHHIDHTAFPAARRSRGVRFWCGQECVQDSFAAAIVIHADQSDVRCTHQWIRMDGSRGAQPAFRRLGGTLWMARRYPKMHVIDGS
jgi:hypothetical protein